MAHDLSIEKDRLLNMLRIHAMDIKNLTLLQKAEQAMIDEEVREYIPSTWKAIRHTRNLKDIAYELSPRFCDKLDAIASAVRKEGGELTTHGDLVRFWEKNGKDGGRKNILSWLQKHNIQGINYKTISFLEDFLRKEGDI